MTALFIILGFLAGMAAGIAAAYFEYIKDIREIVGMYENLVADCENQTRNVTKVLRMMNEKQTRNVGVYIGDEPQRQFHDVGTFREYYDVDFPNGGNGNV